MDIKDQTRLSNVKPEVYKEIVRLWQEEGYTKTAISNELKKAYGTVLIVIIDYCEKNRIDEKTRKPIDYCEDPLQQNDYKWLAKNWHWRLRKKPRLLRKNGYRVVYKGEKGHLRTPYRPDGVFK